MAKLAGRKWGKWLARVINRLALLKVGWWVFGLEGWCGLPLPWGVALFGAILFACSRTIEHKHTHDVMGFEPGEMN